MNEWRNQLYSTFLIPQLGKKKKKKGCVRNHWKLNMKNTILNWKIVTFSLFFSWNKWDKSCVPERWRPRIVSHNEPKHSTSPAASQARLLFDPATASSRETLSRLLQVPETGAKHTPAPVPGCLVCAAHKQPDHRRLRTQPEYKCAVYQNKTGSERTRLLCVTAASLPPCGATKRRCELCPENIKVMDIELWLIFTNRRGRGETKRGVVRLLKIHYTGRERKAQMERRKERETKAERSGEVQREKSLGGKHLSLLSPCFQLTLLQSHGEGGSQWRCSTGKCSWQPPPPQQNWEPSAFSLHAFIIYCSAGVKKQDGEAAISAPFVQPWMKRGQIQLTLWL